MPFRKPLGLYPPLCFCLLATGSLCAPFFCFVACWLPQGEVSGETAEYVVVGHCCESGDLLTPVSGAASEIARRPLDKAEIGKRERARQRKGGRARACQRVVKQRQWLYPAFLVLCREIEQDVAAFSFRVVRFLCVIGSRHLWSAVVDRARFSETDIPLGMPLPKRPARKLPSCRLVARHGHTPFLPNVSSLSFALSLFGYSLARG